MKDDKLWKIVTHSLPEDTAMTHEELASYIRGEMSPIEREEFEALLAVKPELRLEVLDFERELRLELDEDRREPKASELKSRERERRSSFFSFFAWAPAGMAALALISVVFALNERSQTEHAVAATRREREQLNLDLRNVNNRLDQIGRQAQLLASKDRDLIAKERGLRDEQRRLENQRLDLEEQKAELAARSRIGFDAGSPGGLPTSLATIFSRATSIVASLKGAGTRGFGVEDAVESIVATRGHMTAIDPSQAVLKWQAPSEYKQWLLTITDAETGAPVWPAPGEEPPPIKVREFHVPRERLRNGRAYVWSVHDAESNKGSVRFGFVVNSASDRATIQRAIRQTASLAGQIDVLLSFGQLDAAKTLIEEKGVSNHQKQFYSNFVKFLQRSGAN